MNTILVILIVLFAGATAFVLVRGVMTMAQGRDISGEKSNRLMSLRVIFQMLAILAVVLLFVLGGRGGG